MLEILVKITRDINGNIISIFSPDLGEELLQYATETIVNENNYVKYVTDIINNKFIYNIQNITLKTFNDIRYLPIDSSKNWEIFVFKSKNNSGFFTKALPVTGHIANITGIFTGGFITYMALMIASSNNSDDTDKSALDPLSVSGTLLNAIISFLIYIYSDASKILKDTGQIFDNLITPTTENINNQDITDKNTRKKYIQNSLMTLSFGTVLANILISGISTYQECTLLADKYLNLYDLTNEKKKEYKNWINSGIVLGICVGGYTTMAFQSIFANRLIQTLTDKMYKDTSIPLKRHGLFYQYVNANSATGNTTSISEELENNDTELRNRLLPQ